MGDVAAVTQAPGWWKVTDRTGDVAFFEFREDGRARMIRGRFWDWCRVQGEWEPAISPECLAWANADPKPTRVWGEPGFFAATTEGSQTDE
jgi:hypothetical protein